MAPDGVRLDRWLWAARFYKSRSLAHAACAGGKVYVNGQRAKPSRALRIGDRLHVTLGEWRREAVVRALSERRGPAIEARTLYEYLSLCLPRGHSVRRRPPSAAPGWVVRPSASVGPLTASAASEFQVRSPSRMNAEAWRQLPAGPSPVPRRSAILANRAVSRHGCTESRPPH